MDRGIYVAMTGARETFLGQETHANNLANVSTIGFKADFQQMRSMPMFGDVHPTRVFAMTERAGTDLRQGETITTGRPLDVAVKGEGWIAVQDADGNEAFTRAGNMDRDVTGALTTAGGYPVLGQGGPIVLPDYENLEVGSDGAITVRALGEGPLGLAQVDRVKLVNPDPKTLVKGKDGLFRTKDGTKPNEDPAVQLMSGALEGSNVSAVGELTAIISTSRSMDLNVKMIAAFKENDQAAARFMQN